jgi:hypothetical protein
MTGTHDTVYNPRRRRFRDDPPTCDRAAPSARWQMRHPRGLVEHGLLVLQGRPWRRDPAMPAAGRRWPICIAFARTAAGQSCTAGGTTAVADLPGIGCGGHPSLSPHCFFCAAALRRTRPRPNLPIGFAASKSPAPRVRRATVSRAAHRPAIVRSRTTRPMPAVAIGSPPRVSGSRYRPTRSCNALTTRPDAASPACAMITGIRSCAVLSERPRAERKLHYRDRQSA